MTTTPPPTNPVEQPWTTRRLLEWMSGAFRDRGVDSPRLSAEILVAHVLSCDRLRLYMDPERPASAEERDTLRSLVKRALSHEPIQYLTGEAWFFGLPMKSDRRALIPRPCTETIVEHVLQHARRAKTDPSAGRVRTVADVCTGSGCIAVALAKHLKDARVTACDISAEALALAAENAARHGVTDRVEFREGDLLSPLAGDGGAYDVIVSNPPYIPDDEWGSVAPNVKQHEPHGALRGGPDGLTFVRRLVVEAPAFLRAQGWLVVELAASHAPAALGLAASSPALEAASLLQDHEGLPRVLTARRR